ncbi:MAG: acyl-CoA dehydrogenase family protein [Pseudomonadota bacterium]
MDFSVDPQSQELIDAARDFASRELGADLVARDHRGAKDESDWRGDWHKCAEFGVLGLNVPTEYGGRGLNTVDTIMVLEAIGYGCPDNGLTLGLNGQIWAVQEPIQTFGTPQQKQRYLPGLANGQLIGAHGMTEEASGSNAFGLSTVAERDGDEYVLNGHKTYIGLGPTCDLAIVFATTDPSLGQWGLSAFLVEASTAGFTRGEPQQKMGLRTAPMGELTLENCRVPADAMLGPAGAGQSIFQHSMEWERSFIFASHVGSMARQLDECVAFARKREVFGQPIANYQSISNRLAEMKLRLETSRLLLYRAAWSMDNGGASAAEAALAKLHISEAFVASSLDAIRIHGGKGYLSEAGVERDLRDAAGGVIYSGTSDIQRQVIARLLGV